MTAALDAAQVSAADMPFLDKLLLLLPTNIIEMQLERQHFIALSIQ